MTTEYEKDTQGYIAEAFGTLVTILLAVTFIVLIADSNRNDTVLALVGVAFVFSFVFVLYSYIRPDVERAHQASALLKLASKTSAYLQNGLDEHSAQRICEMLLPNTRAFGIAITDTVSLLGYAGMQDEQTGHFVGNPLETKATRSVLFGGQMKVFYSKEEIGSPVENTAIKSAIIVPLMKGRYILGTLQFYYHRPRQINKTQLSVAEGFGQLLSIILAAYALDEQTKLATQMELKALQNQINPHFLFNTINTIASLIRTDPAKARTLLREFAVFYRRTLEDSDGLIMLSREADQTVRYFSFEVARFGEDRLRLVIDEEDGVKDMLVPPFLLQPLVENAVHHAMPAEGMLTITMSARIDDSGDLVISVSDDGVGMDEETCANIMHAGSSTGMGIAVKNVHDRIIGYFGPGSSMEVTSELGKGTTVTLTLHRESSPQLSEKDFDGALAGLS